jgi:hypothetical protein
MALADEVTERKHVKVGNSCVDDPFYVQWLNRYGGKSYWLFGVLNTGKVTTKEIGYYEKYVDDLETAQGNDGILSKSKEITETVGASIPEDQMDGITGLFCSPKVKLQTEEFWPAEAAKWIDVRIKPGSLIISQTNKEFYEVSFEVVMPKQYVISE